jgi:hypothetical protein
MITLTVSYFTQKDSIYAVTLGNGCIHEFSSEKKCKKFLVKTSKFLTSRYNELNLIFSDIFTLYRQIYFYFDNNRETRKAEIYELRREINRLISYSEALFEKLSFSSDFSTTNSIQFIQLNAIIESLMEIVISIKKINENKSYAATQVRCDFLLNQLQSIRTSIQNYSVDKATGFEAPSKKTSFFDYKAILKIVS